MKPYSKYRQESNCEECGASFVYYSNLGPGRFCSRKCYVDSGRRKNLVRCERCGKEFKSKPYRIKRAKRLYCSNECRTKDMIGDKHSRAKPKRRVMCECCGKTILVSPSRRTRYCSKQCAGTTRKEKAKKRVKKNYPPVECENCGRVFNRTQNQRSKPSKHLFCSRECSFEWHRGERGTTWAGGKVSYKCCICGEKTPKKYLRCQDVKYPVCSKACEKQIMKKYFSGPNSYAWKGGITPITLKRRNAPEYKEWRDKVFKRDNFNCVLCGGKNIQAHHLFPARDFPQWIYDVDNGLTLCVECHKKTKGKEYEFLKDMLNGKYLMEIMKVEASSKRIQYPLKSLQQHERDY